VHVLNWPKTRPLTDALGARWRAVVSPGLLTRPVIERPEPPMHMEVSA
jgi:hypothetical protein